MFYPARPEVSEGASLVGDLLSCPVTVVDASPGLPPASPEARTLIVFSPPPRKIDWLVVREEGAKRNRTTFIDKLHTDTFEPNISTV